MPKLKTHKGALKRFKVTGTGKILFRRAGKSHLQSTKGPKRRRDLRRWKQPDNPNVVEGLKSAFPYGTP